MDAESQSTERAEVHPGGASVATASTTAPERADARRRQGFVVTTAILGIFLFAAAVPTPLYGFYAAEWHFSSVSLTAVFAVYALALLCTLLTTGSISDALGRRPVIAAAIGLQAVSTVVFIAANGLAMLYLARIIQGLATGLVTAAVAATLIDLQSPRHPGRGALVNAVTPTFGLGGGALVAGALVQYGPAPTRLIYVVELTALVLLAAALTLAPEPVRERRRARLTFKVSVPPEARTAFLSALPALVAPWALGGLYLSLGPSLSALLSKSGNVLADAAVVVVLTLTGGLASLAVNRWPSRRTMLVGCTILTLGVLVTVAGVAATSVAFFYVGTFVAGTGFGSSFLGAFRTLAALAPPKARGGMVAAVYLVAYLAFSLPAVAAGIMTAHLGLRTTAIAYGVALAVLAGLAVPATARATGPAQP